MNQVYIIPDSLFKSQPAPDAILNDWTGMDFTVTMGLWDVTTKVYKTFQTFELRDVDKNVKPKGKKARIGKDGGIWFVLPIINKGGNMT